MTDKSLRPGDLARAIVANKAATASQKAPAPSLRPPPEPLRPPSGSLKTRSAPIVASVAVERTKPNSTHAVAVDNDKPFAMAAYALAEENARQLSLETIQDAPSLLARLEKSSTKLNAATDGLNAEVAILDGLFKKLSLGVEAWVLVLSEDSADDDYHYLEELGYAKVGGRWGVSLRTSELENGGEVQEEEWSFSQAPRDLRVRAISHIPALLKQLCVEAEKMVETVSSGTQSIRQLAVAFAMRGEK